MFAALPGLFFYTQEMSSPRDSTAGEHQSWFQAAQSNILPRGLCPRTIPLFHCAAIVG